MKKFQNNALNGVENKIGEKTFLEFTVHLLENELFNPIVFSHDNGWFNRNRYSKVLIGFINLLSFLYSCGVTIETELEEPCDIEAEIYRNIMKDTDVADNIVCYSLLEADFTNLNLKNARIPDNCDAEVFDLVKIYLYLRTGAALNRKAIENIIQRSITDAEMQTIRKQYETITGRKMIKRKDNSYEEGGEYNGGV